MFILLSGLPARAGDGVTFSASAGPAVPTARGALYRISYHGHSAYLFGTIHVGRPDFFPLEQEAARAFAAAHTYALEVDVSDGAALQAALAQRASYAGNDTLDRHLSPAGLQRTRKALEKIEIPYAAVARAKPWMVANLFELTLLEHAGYRSAEGVDVILLQQAQAQGKKIVALESAEYQMSLFDAMSDRDQEQYLIDSLDEMQSGETVRQLQELLAAWEHADQAALDAALRDVEADQSASGKFFREALLARRNPVMADKIAALAQAEDGSFTGVGVMHLLGPGGIPQLLAKRGFEVTRIY